MSEIFGKRFDEAFEYAYSRPSFKSFLLKRKGITAAACAIVAIFYLALVFLFYKLGNNSLNIAFAVFLAIILFFLLAGGYPLIRNLIEHIYCRKKKSLEGYGIFLIDTLNAYFDEDFSEGGMDFDKSVYEESRPVNGDYENCCCEDCNACICIKLINGVEVRALNISAYKSDPGPEVSIHHHWNSVFAAANIKTYGKLNLCNYEWKTGSFSLKDRFKLTVDEGLACIGLDGLMRALEDCEKMLNITAIYDKIYIEIAESTLSLKGLSRKKLVREVKTAIVNLMLIMEIVYGITGTSPSQNNIN